MNGPSSLALACSPLELFYQRPGLPSFELPPLLRETYASDLGFTQPRLYANFVASADGVVALRGAGESGAIVSGANQADQFVMGLLRACADAVLIGAGTFRASPGTFWHGASAHPPSADHFAAFRSRRGLRPEPRLVVVTGSGQIDLGQPALEDALIVTTSRGAARIDGHAPAGARVIALDAILTQLESLVALLRAEGLRLILTEGGPSLMGGLIRDRLLDELFLTVSPRLFGRIPGDGRQSLIHGLDAAGAPLELLSARRHESHLFLRYALPGGATGE